MQLSLSEELLQPRLIACRVFDSAAEGLICGHRTRRRTAQSYEFSFYLIDGGTLCLPDGDRPIRHGTCRFIPPGTSLCSIPHYRAFTVYFSLAPEVDGRQPHCRNSFLDSIPLCYVSRMPEAYPPLLEKLRNAAFRAEIGSAITVKRLLYELLSLIQRDAAALPSGSAAERAVATVQEYLEQHLDREVSLAQLGELTGYHPLYLQRLFKQATGQTPHEQLTRLRLLRAQELLMSTGHSAGYIAAACGYSSVSHFNNLFKRQTGLTPLAYRKQSRILP